MIEKKLWPACLPDIENEFFGDTTYVAGWGITRTKYVRVSFLRCDLRKITLNRFLDLFLMVFMGH